jgi:hypothetical protein
MSTISGDPRRLEAYTEDTQPLIPPVQRAVGAYRGALRAFHAAPNDLGTTVVDRGDRVAERLRALRDLDGKPAAFAWALRQLDRRISFSGRLATGRLDLFDELVAARLALPHGDDDRVHEQALAALADAHAARLAELAMADGSTSQWDPAMVAESPELLALFTDIALTAHANPAFADLLVERLGAEGVHGVVNFLSVGATAWNLSGDPTAGANPFRTMLASFAGTLQVAARDGGVDQAVLDALLDPDTPGATPLNIALILAGPRTGTWSTRFLEPAALVVFDAHQRVPASHLDTLALLTFDGDMRQGALQAVARNPEAAWALLDVPRFRDEVLFGVFNDRGALAGDVVRVALHDHVAEGGASLEAARARLDEIARLVYDQDNKGWAIFGRGDQLNGGVREGLAWAFLPHMDGVARDLTTHALVRDERAHMERLLAKVMGDDAGSAVLSSGFGVYLHAQLSDGVVRMADGQGTDAFVLPGQDIGALAVLFLDAEGTAHDDADSSAFIRDALGASAQVGGRLLIAATPLTGGTSTIVGGGLSFVIGEVVSGMPVSEHDRRGGVFAHREAVQLAALQAIAANDEMAARYGLPDELRDRLRDDAYLEALLRDPAERRALWADPELEELLSAVIAIENATMQPFIGAN